MRRRTKGREFFPAGPELELCRRGVLDIPSPDKASLCAQEVDVAVAGDTLHKDPREKQRHMKEFLEQEKSKYQKPHDKRI